MVEPRVRVVIIHVYPENDLYPHNTDSAECPCCPRIEQEGRTVRVIHNAWDQRDKLSPVYVRRHPKEASDGR